MFKGLNTAEREKLIDNLQEVRFSRGAEILKQGDPGETFYIVKTGTVKVTQLQKGASRAETIKEALSSGDYFGEMALLESQPRMATVTASLGFALGFGLGVGLGLGLRCLLSLSLSLTLTLTRSPPPATTWC